MLGENVTLCFTWDLLRYRHFNAKYLCFDATAAAAADACAFFLFFQLLSTLMGISPYGRQNPKLSSVCLCQFLMSTDIFHHCDSKTGQIIKSTHVNGWFLYSISLTHLYAEFPFGWVHLNAMRFQSCRCPRWLFPLISCMFTCVAIFVHQKIYRQTYLPVFYVTPFCINVSLYTIYQSCAV